MMPPMHPPSQPPLLASADVGPKEISRTVTLRAMLSEVKRALIAALRTVAFASRFAESLDASASAVFTSDTAMEELTTTEPAVRARLTASTLTAASSARTLLMASCSASP